MPKLTIKLFAGLVVGLAGLFIAARLIFAQQEPRFVRIGVYDNPPKIYRDENGQVTGVYGDVLNYIGEQENWQINYVPGTFNEGLQRLANGEIDVMVDVAYSEDRAKLYDFSNQAVMSSWGVVYIPKNSSIDSIEDLDGKRVAILKSSVYSAGTEGFDRYIGAFELDINFFELEEYQDVFTLLTKGEVDAAVVSRISGLTAEMEYDNIKATDIIFSPTELRFALTKGDADNPYLVERLDYWVKLLRDGHEGVFNAILEKHNLMGLAPRVEVIPPWLLPVGLGLIIFLLVSWGAVIVFRSAKKTALRRLAEKERYLSRVISNTPVALAIFDKNGVITLAEGKALTDLPLEPSKLVGSSAFEVFKDYPILVEKVHDALSGVESQYQTEFMGRIFQVMSSPLQEDHQVKEVAVIAIDITEEKRLERAKADFITLVQHQLRTPPGAMKWGIELLGPKVLKVLDKEEKNIWQLLESETTRMINLANSLSFTSEVETGLLPVKPETFDLQELVETITKEFIKLIEEKKLTVSNRLADVKPVTQDKTVMGIVLQTLISNAVYYSVPGGAIEIGAQDKPEQLVISVKDSGPGIPKHQQAKVFTRLFRGDQASIMNPEGIGMALYLTKLMLGHLGGKIWFETEVGKGSTFYVELPKKSEPVKSQK